MKIDYKNYEDYYCPNGKFKDNWQECIKILPFISFAHIKFDKNCGLLGLVGEYIRRQYSTRINPIDNFKTQIAESLKNYLKEKNMPNEQIEKFIKITENLLIYNENIKPIDSFFLRYLPLVPKDDYINQKEKEDYERGINKIVDYLLSLGNTKEISSPSTHNDSNLFIKILKESLENNAKKSITNKSELTYYILPYIKETFKSDLKWFLNLDDAIIVKYIPLLLYFYTCYSIVQIIIYLLNRINKDISSDKPVSLYFLLSTEKASLNSEAILNGFMSKISKENLSYLFAKVQALDIVNCLLKNDKTMLYPQIIEKLSETSFEENKNVCIQVLKNYYENKKSILAKRQNAQELEFDDDFFSLENYEDFINKLEKICVSSISKEYTTKLPNKIYDLLNIRFLQQRRENKVLVLDNEMLIFLIALFTRSEKTKLTDVYRRFNDYGICFSRNTKLAIESLLLKLNLLDIKSDAGEAQYVRVIL